MDRSAIEELFERNADMRLLELRHSDSGRTAGAVRHVSTSFGSESEVAADLGIRAPEGPRLRVGIAAVPAAGVIPGALVNVAIDVFNDGVAPAPQSKLVLSLPIESEFRTGTLRADGREVQQPERLFGDGLPIGRLPGNSASKVIFQLHVLPGLNPLFLQPRLQANGVPVVGTVGISIKRAGKPVAAREPEKPFYELTDEEHAVMDAEAAAPIVPPVLPPVPPLAERPPDAVTPAHAETADAVAADAVVPADAVPAAADALTPPNEATSHEAPAVAAPLARQNVPLRRRRVDPLLIEPAKPAEPTVVSGAAPAARMTCFRTLSSADVALLERLFTPERPGIVAHFVLISTLACHESEAGSAPGYAAFLAADGERLGRALVLSRLGKNVDYRPTQEQLDTLALTWLPDENGPPPTLGRDARRLRRELTETECRAINGLVRPSKRDEQLRARIALLALAGGTIEGVPKSTADACFAALASYRSSVLAWLIPLCVATMQRPLSELPEPPTAVDTAARRLTAALRAAYAI